MLSAADYTSTLLGNDSIALVDGTRRHIEEQFVIVFVEPDVGDEAVQILPYKNGIVGDVGSGVDIGGTDRLVVVPHVGVKGAGIGLSVGQTILDGIAVDEWQLIRSRRIDDVAVGGISQGRVAVEVVLRQVVGRVTATCAVGHHQVVLGGGIDGGILSLLGTYLDRGAFTGNTAVATGIDEVEPLCGGGLLGSVVYAVGAVAYNFPGDRHHRAADCCFLVAGDGVECLAAAVTGKGRANVEDVLEVTLLFLESIGDSGAL